MNLSEIGNRLQSLTKKLSELDSKKRREDAMTVANKYALKPEDTYAYAYGQARQMLASLQHDIALAQSVNAPTFERIPLAEVIDVSPLDLAERNAEIIEPCSSYRVVALTVPPQTVPPQTVPPQTVGDCDGDGM